MRALILNTNHCCLLRTEVNDPSLRGVQITGLINSEGFLFGTTSYKRYVFGNTGIHSVSACPAHVRIDVNMSEFCSSNIPEAKSIL